MLRNLVNLASSHPVAMLLALSLMALAIQVLVDLVLGDTAEYFNAARVFMAWKELLSGGDPQAISFLAGQEKLGPMALPAGTAILFLQPILYGGLIFLGIRLVQRFL